MTERPQPRTTVQRTVILPSELYARVREYQRRTGIGWMAMLREALERLLAEERS
jgi:predicted DNA-binding protein